MALNISNLDRISKDDVLTGEGLKNVQDYVNKNVTAAVGNKQQPPPASTGAIQGVTTSAVVKQSPPPAQIINDPGGIGGRRS